MTNETVAAYQPSELYRRVRPNESGNVINGLGEHKPRRPSSVFHRVEFDHRWRSVQQWLHDVTDSTPEIFAAIKRCMTLEACGICLAACPWVRDDAAETLTEKMLRRRARRDLRD